MPPDIIELLELCRAFHGEHYGAFEECDNPDCRTLGEDMNVLIVLEKICQRIRK